MFETKSGLDGLVTMHRMSSVRGCFSRIYFWVRGSVMVLVLFPFAIVFSGCFSRPESQKPGKFPEQIVYCRTSDDLVNAGVLFAPPKNSTKSIAVIWIHGWGANFYQPTYIQIGRTLAEQGYACVAGNTR